MSREVRDIMFTLIVLAVVSLAVWEARMWDLKARLFPWVIGFPLIFLLAVLLATQVVRLTRGAGHAREAHHVRQDTEQTEARRRAINIVGWLLGFLVAILLLGFPIGGTLGTLAYLKLAGREKWPISLAITAGTAVFFVIMVNGLNVPFPNGPVIEGVQSVLGMNQAG